MYQAGTRGADCIHQLYDGISCVPSIRQKGLGVSRWYMKDPAKRDRVPGRGRSIADSDLRRCRAALGQSGWETVSVSVSVRGSRACLCRLPHSFTQLPPLFDPRYISNLSCRMHLLTPNHIQLVSACYPPSSALPTAGPDYSPNSQELSRLTYYAANRPGKISKLGNELEKRIKADSRKAAAGNSRARPYVPCSFHRVSPRTSNPPGPS